MTFLSSRIRQHRRVTSNRHQIEMDSGDAVWVCVAQTRRNKASPVAALSAEARITKHVNHQVREAVGNLLDSKSALVVFERKPIAWEGRRDHCEGVVRVSSEPGRIGEPWNDVEELENG